MTSVALVSTVVLVVAAAVLYVVAFRSSNDLLALAGMTAMVAGSLPASVYASMTS